jgi:hypothetical protein
VSESSRSSDMRVWNSLMSSRTSRSRRSEEELRERLRDLRLAGARRAEEQEDAERSRGVGQAGLDHRHALDDAAHCVGLLEDAFLEERPHVLEPQRHVGVEEGERQSEDDARAARTSPASNSDRPASTAPSAAARTRRRRLPGGDTPGRNCCARSYVLTRVPSSAVTSRPSVASAARETRSPPPGRACAAGSLGRRS